MRQLAILPQGIANGFEREARHGMSSRARATVTSELRLRLLVSGDSSLTIPAVLRYDTSDPHAVHATFYTGENETVDWVFARELLAEGLRQPSGFGDVRVWPSRSQGSEVVCVSLSSPEGHALLEAPAEDLRVFLNRTYVTVPPGIEHQYLDLDSELVALLEGELPA